MSSYNNNYHNNRHHSNSNSSQQYHHRGALTKLTSSATSTSGVGSFSSAIGGGASGVGGFRRGIGAGLGSLGRNVPKLVNTSSLRKENGGQDITAVLVNRGGELVRYTLPCYAMI